MTGVVGGTVVVMAGEVVMVGADCGQGVSNDGGGGSDADGDSTVRSVVMVEVIPGGQVVMVAMIMSFPFC